MQVAVDHIACCGAGQAHACNGFKLGYVLHPTCMHESIIVNDLASHLAPHHGALHTDGALKQVRHGTCRTNNTPECSISGKQPTLIEHTVLSCSGGEPEPVAGLAWLQLCMHAETAVSCACATHLHPPHS